MISSGHSNFTTYFAYEQLDYIDTATMVNAMKIFDALNGFIFKDSLEIGMDPKLWAVIGIRLRP